MDVITHAALRSLIEAGSPPCVSIFMPTHRTGRDIRQDPIRLKDLLRDAEAKLMEQGVDKRTTARVLQHAQNLLEDDTFWQNSDNGLAIFLSESFSKTYRTPIEVDDMAFVNDHFYVKPLLPLATGKLYYVLAVSQGAARLLECTPFSCRVVPLPEDVATSMDEAIRGEEEHQTHTIRRGGGDASNPFSGAGAYHGQAQDVQQKAHEDLMFYLRQLDDGVRRAIGDHDAPVVLAGVDSVTPFYRQVSSLRNLCAEDIPGNAEHVPNETLSQRAKEILEPVWKKELNQLQERYGTGTAQGLSSHDSKEIVAAAETGRVDTLFVPIGYHKVGRNNEVGEDVHLRTEPGVSDDVLDQAITATLLTSGRVVPVLKEQMPGNHDLAAIFRYPAQQAAAS